MAAVMVEKRRRAIRPNATGRTIGEIAYSVQEGAKALGIGQNRVGWSLRELQEWIEARKMERDTAA